jgi:hypothetical protein
MYNCRLKNGNYRFNAELFIDKYVMPDSVCSPFIVNITPVTVFLLYVLREVNVKAF